MSRQIYHGLPVIDQLPVYEPDGVTKRSGLTAADFTVAVWHDGAERPGFAVAITEIGSGEYRVEFTPDATGYWVVEVANGYNTEIWVGEYDVVKPVLLGIT